MIFDSKRRQTREADAEAATLLEAPHPARSVAPDDMRTTPVGTNRLADRGAYREDDPATDWVADARTDESLAEGAVEPAADRSMERNGKGIDDRAEVGRSDRDELEPLLPTDVAEDFRRGWDTVQIGFVDDPQQAVRHADELVTRVLRSLSETITGERSRVDARAAEAEPISTEDLRVAMRRYRSFLHRLLSV
jgi:hypothetical protein